MADVYRNPDNHFVGEVASLRRDVELLKRLPSGLQSIGTPHLAPPPYCQVSVVAQTLTTGTPATIAWGSETSDNAGMFTSSASTTRITPTVSGLWLVTADATFVLNATGRRRVSINAVATEEAATEVSASSVNASRITVAQVIPLSVGSYFEIVCYQNSGGNLDVGVSGRVLWVGNL